jgi:hypothetical protein
MDEIVNMKKKNGKLPLHAMKLHMASGGIAPFILNLGTRLRYVISLMPQSP